VKIIFAKNLGFCFGVKRALNILEKSIKNDSKPIYLLGEIVHNEKVIQKLKKEGVKIVFSPREVKNGTLIIRAHGFPPFKISRKVILRNATCPFVKRVQDLACNLSKDGYQVVIFGKRNHPEVIGISAFSKNKALIVENKSQAKKLPKFKKIGFISQTTSDEEKFFEILEILKKKAKEFKYFNTICPQVKLRQKELKEILKKVEAVLVIGSKSSSNTQKLAKIVKNSGKKLIWINSLKELKKKNLKEISSLGVVSGTSAPNFEIEKIKNYLQKFKN
jgi:4-hydroxy-3-methylbut-2-enyl diphosphate reductase